AARRLVKVATGTPQPKHPRGGPAPPALHVGSSPSNAVLDALLAVPEGVQATRDQTLERATVPGVEEVGIPGVLPAGPEREPGSASPRRADVDLDGRHRDRVVRRTAA